MSSASRGKSGLLLHGDRVGRYRILTHVADGGMAAVYLAELDGPSAFRKQLALKVIHPHLMHEVAFVKMFVDEARLAARLHHPNIVQTFDLVHSRERLAIAMEYAPGLPASSLLPKSSRRLEVAVTPELVAYVGAEAAAALHHAHTLTDQGGDALGVVHCDISPMNVHIGLDGRVRVVDFGIARARGRLSSTAHGVIKGTFAYVAPERFTGVEPTSRSDIWSLGVVLWELLAGERLFRRANEPETARAVVTAPIPALETRRRDLPPALTVAIHRALERDPEQRWASAKEMEEHLRAALPRRLEIVRDPLLLALAPHREQHWAELRELLEVEGGDASGADSESGEVVEIVADASEEFPLPPVEEGESREQRPTDSTPMSAADLAAPPAPRRRKGVLAAIGVAAAIFAVLLVIAQPDRHLPPATAASPAAAETPPVAPGPTPVAAPAPELAAAPPRVSLEVTSKVRNARVLLDGRVLGRAPLRTLIDRDSREHLLRVEAPGRVPAEQRVRFDAPVQLALDPAAPAAPTPIKAPGRRWRKTLTFDRNVYR